MASGKVYGFFRIDEGGAVYWLHAWDSADAKALLVSCLTQEVGEHIDDIDSTSWEITPMTLEQAAAVKITESGEPVSNVLAEAGRLGRGVIGCSEWD